MQLGCVPPIIYGRLARGWSADDAVSIPVGKHGGRHPARPTGGRARPLTALGVTRTVKEWAVQLGCSPAVLYARLATGWSADDAVSIPVGKHSGRQAARPTKPEAPASPRPAPTGLGFVSGSSLRREDCARYEACLTRAARTAGCAGCPAGCAGFERARRAESPGCGSTARLLGAA